MIFNSNKGQNKLTAQEQIGRGQERSQSQAAHQKTKEQIAPSRKRETSSDGTGARAR